MNKSINF